MLRGCFVDLRGVVRACTYVRAYERFIDWLYVVAPAHFGHGGNACGF